MKGEKFLEFAKKVGVPPTGVLAVSFRERPILFSAPMARAILDGRKTQTRRIVRTKEGESLQSVLCPYGIPGDRLWVRETTRMRFLQNFLTGEPTNAECAEYVADGQPVLDPNEFDYAWWYSRKVCPAIHMPRWASRITLEITGVHVERLQDISRNDCIAEGCPSQEWYRVDGGPEKWFHTLWDDIHGDRANWNSNPWVWCIAFRRVVVPKDDPGAP